MTSSHTVPTYTCTCIVCDKHREVAWLSRLPRSRHEVVVIDNSISDSKDYMFQCTCTCNSNSISINNLNAEVIVIYIR